MLGLGSPKRPGVDHTQSGSGHGGAVGQRALVAMAEAARRAREASTPTSGSGVRGAHGRRGAPCARRCPRPLPSTIGPSSRPGTSRGQRRLKVSVLVPGRRRAPGRGRAGDHPGHQAGSRLVARHRSRPPAATAATGPAGTGRTTTGGTGTAVTGQAGTGRPATGRSSSQAPAAPGSTTSPPPSSVPATGGGGPPALTALTPSTGAAGQSVVVSGTNFISADGVVQARFGGQLAPTACPVQTSCTVTVPTMTGSPTSVPVTITTTGGTSNALTFTFG